jgi:transcriptional regulator with XRE-family HTH domain
MIRNVTKSRRENPWFQQFGRRVDRAMKAQDLNQSTLGERMGVDRSTVNRWIAQGQCPDPPDLFRLADVLGLPVLELLGGGTVAGTSGASWVAEDRTSDEGTTGFVRLSRHAAQIGAGPGFVDALEEPREYQFTEAWLKRLGYSSPERAHLQVFKVAHTYGDSMEPTIRPDAILLADMGAQGRGHTRVENGRVYVLDIARGLRAQEKGLVVKRVKHQKHRGSGDELVLWGDNRAVAPETIAVPEDYPLQDIVRGLVRWVGQEVP